MKKKLLYENKWIRLWEDDIEFPNGDNGIYAYIDRKTGGPLIIPMTSNNELVMIYGHRYPRNIAGYGFPIGDQEPGETQRQTAERELQEETGITAKEWIELGELRIDPGYNTQTTTVFLAKDLQFGNKKDDPKEIHEVHRIPMTKVDELVVTGEISSGWALAGLCKLKVFLNKKSI